MTIAADTAQLGEIQIRHGFGPPILIAPFLVGLKQAKELLLLGEMVSAAEAQRLGLVNKVVPEDQVMAEAESWARKLAALNQRTVRTNKVLVNRAYELAGFREALNYRGDPSVAAAAAGTSEDQSEHIRTLREQGWDAFRRSRDVLYRPETQEA
jgi:enoyl-CoA hydratase/carnithine racemase